MSQRAWKRPQRSPTQPSPPLPYHEQGCHLLSQALAQVAQGPSYPLRVGKNRHRASFCYFLKVSWFLGTQDQTSLIMTQIQQDADSSRPKTHFSFPPLRCLPDFCNCLQLWRKRDTHTTSSADCRCTQSTRVFFFFFKNRKEVNPLSSKLVWTQLGYLLQSKEEAQALQLPHSQAVSCCLQPLTAHSSSASFQLPQKSKY